MLSPDDYAKSLDEKQVSDRLTLRRDILNGVVAYFRETGCAAYFDERRSLVVVSAPQSRDEWWIDFADYTASDSLRIRPSGHYYGDRGTKKKCLQVDLTDPNSFPNLLKFINSKSKFLRGGLGNHRYIAVDPEDAKG